MVLYGIVVIKNKELAIKSVKVDRIYLYLTIKYRGFIKKSLISIKSFKVINSPRLLNLLSIVPLLYLERLKVVDY